MNLRTRLAKLETGQAGRHLVIWRNHGETNEQATERWKVEHPGQDPDSADFSVMVVGWGEPE